MGLQWSAKIIKHFLFLLNLLFVITGLVIICVGVTVKAKYTTYNTFLDSSYFSLPNLLIAIGCIIFFVAFFGCCGAIKENYCMTVTFSVLLVLIFILEFAAGISGYVLRNSTSEYINKQLQESLDKYQFNPDPNNVTIITKTWDIIQETFHCCGIYSYHDWEKNPGTENLIPISCCDIQYGMVEQYVCNSTNPTLHKDSCAECFSEFIRDHAYTLGSVGLGFAVIQFLGIIFSCKLAKQLKYYDNF